MHLSPERTARHEAVEFLLGRINYEQTAVVPYGSNQFRLDRMRRLLAQLGDPHLQIPVVHVAGTKGKGSTSAFLATMLTASGYRTGLYTSPHLDRLEERFAIDGVCCTADELVLLVQRIRTAVEPMDREALLAGRPESRATWFELTTAMAFLFFQLKQVDITVLEVGLGGRLDSTNVCQPLLAVITSISFDHTRQLGHSLASIAGEKAGILKPGVPAVSGVRAPEAMQVIKHRADELGCPLRSVDESFFYRFEWQNSCPTNGVLPRTGSMDYWDQEAAGPLKLSHLQLGLLGAHQAANAAVSLAAMRVLQQQSWRFSEPAIRQGLAATRCPARVEVVDQNPITIIDAAHNVASAEALIATLKAAFRPQRKTLIFAASRDKDTLGMLRVLLPYFDHIVLTRYQSNPRAAEPGWLEAQARQLLAEVPGSPPQLTVLDSPLDAWQTGRFHAGSQDLLCVTGSFFLAADLRGLVQPSCREV